ncbi:hypothetical protein SKAU_G00067360 [Synaphobranchus kaupii]|uniref:NmrA-like family domain-containing protein 1 n=1 Tax=Synaphobranchus kaupii TaxID=118154 RepID=A0A9Q1JA76_SYNKA|nr:hypothetical protein SKAU_G00067360 [Synaphobranchus kaupii]
MEQVVVLGAEEEPGYGAALALLRDGGFHVCAAATDPGSPQAQNLGCAGAQVLPFHLNSTTGLQGALSGAHKCFFATRTDFTKPDPLQSEISQGYLIADACKQHGIGHVVFEGGQHVQRHFGFPMRSMDAKACISDYMDEIGLRKTQILIPFLYESFLTTFSPKPAGPNLYKIDIPMGDTPMDSISLSDVGPVVTAILKNSHKWAGKSCHLSANRLPVSEYAETLTNYLAPRVFQDSRISLKKFVESYKGEAGQDIGNMFEFWRKDSRRRNAAEMFELFSDAKKFSHWVSTSQDSIITALEK